LKTHQFLDKQLNRKRGFIPYRVKYLARVGDKTIVHVIGNFIVGGSSQLVVDIIEGTSDLYLHKVVVPQIPDQLGYQPLDIHAFSIDELTRLSEFLSLEKPEFVHIHYFVRDFEKYESGALWYQAVFKICEELGIRVVQNVNIPTRPFPGGSVVHNVFVSEYVRNEFNDSAIESSVIYPGSDFGHFQDCTANHSLSNTVGMVYRLDGDKIREESIEVFIEAAKMNSDLKCRIIGGGLLENYFKIRVTKERLNNQFCFTGFVSYEKLPDEYRKLDLFVAPVYEESFGQVTPFAMGMGLRVAGYDTGALGEILGSKETLVETGDVEALARLINELVENKGTLEIRGRQNRQRALAHFSIERMIERYRRLYATVLNS